MSEGTSVGQGEQAMTVRCAWCGRLRIDHEWRAANDFDALSLVAPVTQFSDGICPECLAGFTDRTA